MLLSSAGYYAFRGSEGGGERGRGSRNDYRVFPPTGIERVAEPAMLMFGTGCLREIASGSLYQASFFFRVPHYMSYCSNSRANHVYKAQLLGRTGCIDQTETMLAFLGSFTLVSHLGVLVCMVCTGRVCASNRPLAKGDPVALPV